MTAETAKNIKCSRSPQAWIKYRFTNENRQEEVALRKESVDRNLISSWRQG